MISSHSASLDEDFLKVCLAAYVRTLFECCAIHIPSQMYKVFGTHAWTEYIYLVVFDTKKTKGVFAMANFEVFKTWTFLNFLKIIIILKIKI